VPNDHPTAPSDHTTLTEVLDGYAEAGFDSTFAAQEGGLVRCDACSSVIDASRITMHSLRRLEGASDPDDMIAVVALDCPACGRSGTMVLGFGPAASDEDSDVLRTIQDRRDSDTLPGASPPSETPD
jgi:hypothetical protein